MIDDASETPRPATTNSVDVCLTLDFPPPPSAVSKSSQIFQLPFTDFVTAISLTDKALVFGSVFGKVVYLKLQPSLHPSDAYSDFSGSLRLLQAFSEDAIRAVYADEQKVSAVVGNSHAVEWGIDENGSPVSEGLLRFDRRLSQQMKYVLPYKEKVLVASTGVTLVFDARESQQWLSPLRLMDIDVVPMDFRHDRMIAFIHRPDDGGPSLKVLRLPLSQDEPPWGVTVECVFHQNLPRVTGLAKAGFWGEEHIAFVANGRHLYVFNLVSGNERYHWRGFKADVCAMDTSNPDRIVTITERSILQVWRLSSPHAVFSMSLEPSRFTMGNPYFITSLEHLIVYSADEEIACAKLPLTEG